MKRITIQTLLALATILFLEVLSFSTDVVGLSTPEGIGELRAFHFGVPFRSLFIHTETYEADIHKDRIDFAITPSRAVGDVSLAILAIAAIACLLSFWWCQRLVIGLWLSALLGVLLDIGLRFRQSDNYALFHAFLFIAIVAVAVSITSRKRPFWGSFLSLLAFYLSLFFVQRSAGFFVPGNVAPSDISWAEAVICPAIFLVITYVFSSAWFGLKLWLDRAKSNTGANKKMHDIFAEREKS